MLSYPTTNSLIISSSKYHLLQLQDHDQSTMKQDNLEKEKCFHSNRPFLFELRLHPTAAYWSYQSDQLPVQPPQDIRPLLRFSSVHS